MNIHTHTHTHTHKIYALKRLDFDNKIRHRLEYSNRYKMTNFHLFVVATLQVEIPLVSQNMI